MRATLERYAVKVNRCFRISTDQKPVRNPGADASDCDAMDEAAVVERVRSLGIEPPSWGYGNSGTRFHVYPWPGAARYVHERIADAALVHRLTGCCPRVALHVPWDRVDDWGALGDYADERGIRVGAINPNLFGDDSY